MTESPNDFIHKPHDKFVYKMLQNSEIAKHFMQTYLPDDLLTYLDLDSLELGATHFVDFIGKESQADIVFKARFQEKEAYIMILLEHQSRLDELMPFRILWYTLQIYQQHLDISKDKKVPLVYPVVLYHNQKNWEFSTDIRDYVDAPRELVDRYFLNSFQLIDLSKISGDEIKRDPWVAAVNLPLKHIYSKNMDDFIDSFEGVLLFFEQEIRAKYPETGEFILKYLAENANIRDMATALGLVKSRYGKELGDKFMTLGQQLKKEGRKEGRHEAMIEWALSLKDLGLSNAQAAKRMKISEQEFVVLLSEASNDETHTE